jgi:hypothetical protein
MIRDPSDGSTYTLPKPTVSGLPELQNDMDNIKSEKDAERLEKAREWLKDYHQKPEDISP